MSALFLVCFVGGLLLAVRIMLFGVERVRPFGAEGERSFRVTPPVAAAFLVVFGLVGYLMRRNRFDRMSAAVALGAAILAGLAAAVVAVRLVKKWWLVTPEHDVDDERYVLQGHVARVVTPIAADAEGQIALEVDDVRRVVRARSLEGTPVEAGVEVVIERIDGDVAFVEPWAEVEKRL